MPSYFCTPAKRAFLEALAKHEWKAALYTSKAKLSADMERYVAFGEVPPGNGYVTGGVTLKGAFIGNSNNSAWLHFKENPTWEQAVFTARYMLIYDATDNNRAYVVIDFGSDKTGQGGNFTPRFPTPGPNAAIIQI